MIKAIENKKNNDEEEDEVETIKKQEHPFSKYEGINTLIIQKHIFFGYQGDATSKIYALGKEVT
jgi:hypothetical protein